MELKPLEVSLLMRLLSGQPYESAMDVLFPGEDKTLFKRKLNEKLFHFKEHLEKERRELFSV